MTNEEINIAIAESMGIAPKIAGWFCSRDNGKSGWLFVDTKQEAESFCAGLCENDWRYGSKVFPSMQNPPDYCNDLNAMHEAEESLDCNQLEVWHKIAGYHFLTDEQPYAARLTARQRAEAYLRTIGKWKEKEQ